MAALEHLPTNHDNARTAGLDRDDAAVLRALRTYLSDKDTDAMWLHYITTAVGVADTSIPLNFATLRAADLVGMVLLEREPDAADLNDTQRDHVYALGAAVRPFPITRREVDGCLCHLADLVSYWSDLEPE